MLTKQSGSILLLLVTITALTSMGLITGLLVSHTLKQSIGITGQQQLSRTILSQAAQKRLAMLVTGFDQSRQDSDQTTAVSSQGLSFDIHKSSIKPLMQIAQAPDGYSLNSVYTTQLIRMDTQVSNSSVQSPLNSSFLNCLILNNGRLPSELDSSYPIRDRVNPEIQIEYEFKPGSGEVWRHSAESHLLLDLDLNPEQSLSRPEFAWIKPAQQTRLLITFASTHVQQSGDTDDRLFIVFDNPLNQVKNTLPLKLNELPELNTGLKLDQSLQGVWLDLNQRIDHVALSIYSNIILVLTQSRQMNAQNPSQFFENRLWQIKLNEFNTISTDVIDLAATGQAITLFAQTADQQSIEFITQDFDPVIRLPGECARTATYEF